MESSIDYSRHYKNWHSDTEEHINKVNVVYSKIIADHSPSDKNIRILDVGCGIGFLMLALKKGGFREIKIDPLDYMIPSASFKSFLHRTLLRYFRFWRRLEMIAELGTTWGKKIPLSLNIISKATKK